MFGRCLLRFVLGLCIVLLAAGAQAQSRDTWRLHAAIEGEAKPFLCADRETVSLLVAVLGHAIKARGDSDSEKPKRLLDLGAKLEAELCRRPAADDIVIVRCNLEQQAHGGSQLSIVKVSALLRSDASAGEQPFYAWSYAAIEPSDADAATTQEAERKWCTDEAVTDTALEPTADLVQRVQQRFYDFGYRMAQINGRLTPDTIQGLIDFQRWAGLPPTGQLTRLTVEKIQAAQAPSPWVAVAFDGYGRYDLVRAATRRVAESDAINGLRRKSRSDYRVAAIAYPNCIAFATTRYKSRGRRYTQAFSGAAPSEDAAKQNVLDFCNREKGGGTCQLRDVLCAATSDQPTPRFDPENIPANAPAPKPRFDPKNLPLNAASPVGEGGGD